MTHKSGSFYCVTLTKRFLICMFRIPYLHGDGIFYDFDENELGLGKFFNI